MKASGFLSAMNTQVMIDLETLGTKPGSVIVALGAVKFGNGEILDTFYERIDPESCVELGMKIDVSTVMWWLKQAEEARLEITKPGIPIKHVLLSFRYWLQDPEAKIWGNGAAFDNVLLSDAYDRCGIQRPWEFWNDRCYRTVKGLCPETPFSREGTHHNALDDAASQALHLMQLP